MRIIALSASALVLAACSAGPALPPQAQYGPTPPLPEPRKSVLIPTIKVAKAVGWRGAKPVAAEGLQVEAFAVGLDHPRWLYVLPDGGVLVAETNAPPKKPEGLKGWAMAQVQKIAGAGPKSANRITLLRDTNGDGVAEAKSTYLQNLASPFGMALVGDSFYVANADAVVRFPYTPGLATISAQPQKVVDLPAGINHHWTKNLIASPDGSKLYATVGSNSNVAENGMAAEVNRAAILQFNPDGTGMRVFAAGLRNPNGLAWQPETGALWTAVNERDEIGNDLVPDYITSVKDGAFYGWPYSYYGGHVDTRVKPQRPDLVAKAIAPDYAMGSHTASLGLTFGQGATALPPRYQNGAFVGQHGSWNRKPVAGYKVVFVPFANGMPSGQTENVLTGFLDRDGKAQGRPVGVAVAGDGSLLVADDVGNTIWRVTAKR